MYSVPPSTIQQPPPGRPARTPHRSKLTDHLLYTWERLRPAQQDAAWQMIQHMRTTMVSERRTRKIIGLLIAVALVASAVLVYLLVTAPAH